jgi:hypothetical protein
MGMQTKRLALMIWFVVAYVLISVIVWATLNWPAAALISLVAAIAGVRLWRGQVAMRAGEMPADEKGGAATTQDVTDTAAPDMGALINETLRRDLSLAAEHVHSIRWLLEIARDHQQPIPTAALKNLEMVSKHLSEMRRRVEIAGEEEPAAESEISVVARRPDLQIPPRPQQLSFGCHASPSDRSTPFD